MDLDRHLWTVIDRKRMHTNETVFYVLQSRHKLDQTYLKLGLDNIVSLSAFYYAVMSGEISTNRNTPRNAELTL
jgi:hypothetical protein